MRLVVVIRVGVFCFGFCLSGTTLSDFSRNCRSGGFGWDATGWDCCCGLERGGHRLKQIPKAGIVFKSSLVLSGKAAKDNFTTEPRSPSRLLGRIEPICNRGEEFDEVVWQARG